MYLKLFILNYLFVFYKNDNKFNEHQKILNLKKLYFGEAL